MRICYFGIYNPEYSRNRVLIKGLKENGSEVIECRSDLGGLRKYFDLIAKHWRIRHDYDILIAGFPGNHATVLAKFLTRKPIIIDSFVSFYDSMVFDRRVCHPYSPRAVYYWFLDWLPAVLADFILFDTDTHINYFSRTFGIKRGKLWRVFVGTDDSQFFFRPTVKSRNFFLIHYHASFLPLQGIDYIIQAAKILDHDEIRFKIIGSGPEYGKIRQLADKLATKNVDFIRPVAYSKLIEYIEAADICLGIFGGTPKASRVIPNKIYEAIACKKAVITADQPAIHELFVDNKNIVLCRPSDPQDLVEKILRLKSDSVLRQRVAENAYELFQRELTPMAIAGGLIKKIEVEIFYKIKNN